MYIVHVTCMYNTLQKYIYIYIQNKKKKHRTAAPVYHRATLDWASAGAGAGAGVGISGMNK